MRKILITLAIFAFCGGAYGQKITALTESTSAGETSLLIVREGATGNLLKRITMANLFSGRLLGGTTTVGIAINPDANDGATLGLAATSWSDLFLASGGVINWANSDVTISNPNSGYLLLTGDLGIIGRLDLAQGSIDVTGATISEVELAALDGVTGSLDYATENYGATGTGDIVLGTGPALTDVTITGADIYYTPLSTGTITDATGITSAMLSRFMYYSEAAATDISSDPQIANGTSGQIITIIGSSDTNTLTLDDSAGLRLTGQMVIGIGDNITLMYEGTIGDWVEIGRSAN